MHKRCRTLAWDGGMTALMKDREGYETEFAVDESPDMLPAGEEKASTSREPPVSSNQSWRLDPVRHGGRGPICLSGTGLNYLAGPREVQKTFQRLHLFISPGGPALVFDINSGAMLRERTGRCSRRTGDVYCVWASGVEEASRVCTLGWTSSPTAGRALDALPWNSTGRRPTRWRNCAPGSWSAGSPTSHLRRLPMSAPREGEKPESTFSAIRGEIVPKLGQ